MQLYFMGESLRNVQKFIRQQGVNVAHSTVYKWIKKYTELMKDHLDSSATSRRHGEQTKFTPKSIHIRHISLDGDHNNNKMERLNGEFRDREKIVRGIKKKDSPIFDGYQIYHNYIRPHMSLEGKTPSEACGIEIKGDNKWITVIQNASKSKETH